MNIHTLVGRLGRDPEMRYTNNGTPVVTFSVATDRRSKSQRETDWHNCVAYGKTGEIIAEWFTKGRVIGLVGSVQTRSWDKDGVKHYKTETVVSGIHFIPTDKSGEEGRPNLKPSRKSATEAPPAGPTPQTDTTDDDIPF